jgi:hypothetical protein
MKGTGITKTMIGTTATPMDTTKRMTIMTMGMTMITTAMAMAGSVDRRDAPLDKTAIGLATTMVFFQWG